MERKDRGEKKKKGGRRRRRSGRRRINLFAVRWKTLPAIANFVGDNDEKRGEKKETERTKWMHGNGCESVLRNLPFESGLHGSPDLFSRLSSRSSLADFRFHRAVRTYTRVSSFARDNARLAATPRSKDYQKKKKKNETCSQFTPIRYRFDWSDDERDKEISRNWVAFLTPVWLTFFLKRTRMDRFGGGNQNVEGARIRNFIVR